MQHSYFSVSKFRYYISHISDIVSGDNINADANVTLTGSDNRDLLAILMGMKIQIQLSCLTINLQ